MSKTTKKTSAVVADPTTLAREGGMYNTATALAARPYEAYAGDRVAGTTPLMDQGLAALPGAAAAGAGATNDALAGMTAAGQYRPDMVTAPRMGPALNAGFTGAGPAATMGSAMTADSGIGAMGGAGGTASARDVSSIDAAAKMAQYTNPWENQVVQSALGDQEIQRQQAIRQGQAQATMGGAFGGSRHGVMDSLTNEAAIRAAGSTSGALRSAGFNTALGAGAADANRVLAADQGNQQADVATSVANSAVNAQLAAERGRLAGSNSQFNAGQVNTGRMFDAGQINTGRMFDAGQGNDMAKFNAGQGNDMTRAQGGLDLSAAQGNQNAGLTANGQRIGAAQGMAGIGAQQQNMGLQGADALVRGGQITQGINQAGLDTSYEAWLQKQNDPYNKLKFQQGFTGTAGHTQTDTSKGSALGGILGAVGTIAGGPIGGMIGKGITGLLGGMPKVPDAFNAPRVPIQGLTL